MGRTAAVVWHGLLSLISAGLYYFFVLPRWPELMGQTSSTLGTVLRIATGALIGLAALPVTFTLLRTRKPDCRTPLLALRLRVASIALHVVAGALIIAAAVSEIWLSLETAGRWLFGIYGAAAAIALLGVFAFQLAFVAELPPPLPKPRKVKVTMDKARRRGRGAAAEPEQSDVAKDTEDSDATVAAEEVGETTEPAAEPTEETTETAAETAEPAAEAQEQPAAPDEGAAVETTGGDVDGAEAETTPGGRLRNRRPAGKLTLSGRRKPATGGVAVDD